MKKENELLNKYTQTLSLLVILTAFLSLHSLNRLWGVYHRGQVFLEYPGRIYLEHFLSGFYIPLLFLFIVSVISIIFSILIKKEIKLQNIGKILTAISLIYLATEFLWQFQISYNPDSVFQFSATLLGVLSLWIFYKKIF